MYHTFYHCVSSFLKLSYWKLLILYSNMDISLKKHILPLKQNFRHFLKIKTDSEATLKRFKDTINKCRKIHSILNLFIVS